MAAAVLPSEILFSIVPYLSDAELKAIRLCNKLCSEEAGRYLFHTITILYLRNDFERLKAIARHERLRLRVQKIVYVGDRFPNGLSMEQWRHHYSRDRHAQMNSMVWLRNPYREYQKLSHEQKELNDDDASNDLWSKALSAFSNLREIRLLMREYQKPNNGLLHSVVRRTFCKPDGDMNDILPFGVRCGNAGQFHLRSFMQPRLDGPLRPARSARPRSLHLENVHRCALGHLWVEDLSVCSSLENLHVSFAWDEHDSMELQPKSTWWWFGQLLSAATNLRELHVSHEPNVAFYLPLTHILPLDCLRPKLEVIELSQVRVRVQELACFVAYHRDKLQRLRIEGCDLFDTSAWKLVMATILSAPNRTSGVGKHGDSPMDNASVDRDGHTGKVFNQVADAFNGAAVSHDRVQQVFTATWS